MVNCRSPSRTTMSVNVPPTSTPILSMAPTLYRVRRGSSNGLRRGARSGLSVKKQLSSFRGMDRRRGRDQPDLAIGADLQPDVRRVDGYTERVEDTGHHRIERRRQSQLHTLRIREVSSELTDHRVRHRQTKHLLHEAEGRALRGGEEMRLPPVRQRGQLSFRDPGSLRHGLMLVELVGRIADLRTADDHELAEPARSPAIPAQRP